MVDCHQWCKRHTQKTLPQTKTSFNWYIFDIRNSNWLDEIPKFSGTIQIIDFYSFRSDNSTFSKYLLFWQHINELNFNTLSKSYHLRKTTYFNFISTNLNVLENVSNFSNGKNITKDYHEFWFSLGWERQEWNHIQKNLKFVTPRLFHKEGKIKMKKLDSGRSPEIQNNNQPFHNHCH